MGDLITKDGISVNVGVNKEDLLILAAVIIIAGVIVSVLSGLILRTI